MMTASSIRKQLLNLFEKGILDLSATENHIPALILTEPPFHFPSDVGLRPLPIPLLSEKEFSGEVMQSWEHAEVNSTTWPYLLYLAEGEADLRIGVTQSMGQAMKANGLNGDCGCWVITLRAPAYILYSSGVPYSCGTRAYWERPEAPAGRMVMVSLNLTPNEALGHFSVREKGDYQISQSLLVNDNFLMDAQRILYNELRTQAPGWETVARTQLQTILLRFKRRLATDPSVIASTSWAAPPLNKSFTGAARDVALLSELHEYISIHLREPLSLAQIAARADLSVSQLNRIFYKNLGVTVMQYIIQLRLESAKLTIAAFPHLSIKEVMALAGYNEAAHFSRVFSKAHGISPRAYREQQRKEVDMNCIKSA
jgi:AraC-like DNA-binding protein